MFYRCKEGHEEVRWSWHAGRYCWLDWCGAEGVPWYALVVSPMDNDDHVPVTDALVTS